MKQIKPLNLLRSYTAEFSRTGSLLVTLSNDVVVWDVESRAKRYRVHPFSHPSRTSIHPSEARIIVKNTAGQIALLDAEDGIVIRLLQPAKGNEGSNILHSLCGEFVVDGSWNGRLTVRSSTSGEVVFERDFSNEMITKIARSTNGDRWFVVHQPKIVSGETWPAPAYISIWDWPFTFPAEFVKSTERDIKTISVSPDGRQICLVGQCISVMELAERRIVCSAPYRFGGTGFVAIWSPDSREIATVQEDEFVFYNASTLNKCKSIELGYASDIAYSPDGRQIALAAHKSGILIDR